MNAFGWKAPWHAMTLPARQMRLKRSRQLGWATYEALRRRGLPPPAANAHARFEDEARMALRDWLML